MFETSIAGSLPKPSWLAEPDKLWAPWRLKGEDLEAGKRDATLVAIKLQEDAGIDIVTDGEQSRQHRSTAFSNSSTASISPSASRWASARSATRRWCRR